MIAKIRQPLVRTEITMVIIASALVAPRLAHWGREAATIEVAPEASQAAVGYAQHRLWWDFLAQRSDYLDDHELPPPSLSEYRHFLAGLGLKRTGDRSYLLVPSGLRQARIAAKIDVEFRRSKPPLRVDIFVEEPGGSKRRAGQLEFRVDADFHIQCVPSAVSAVRLWSLWPLRPMPVLP